MSPVGRPSRREGIPKDRHLAPTAGCGYLMMWKRATAPNIIRPTATIAAILSTERQKRTAMIAQITMNADMSVPRGGCREQKP